MAAGASGWVASTGGEITPATAGTAKTFLNVIAATGKVIKVTEIGIGFVGIAAAAKPVLVELCQSTQATAGSGSSAVTLISTAPGDTQTVQATAAKNYSSEPTALTVIREWLVHPQSSLVEQFPLGREPVSGVADGICLRVTFASAETLVNGRCYVEVEE